MSPRHDLAQSPHFPSLTRPILIAGVERELVIPITGLALVLFAQLSWASAALAAAVLLALPPLRRASEADPQLFAVFKRHLKTAGFYAHQARWDAPARRLA